MSWPLCAFEKRACLQCDSSRSTASILCCVCSQDENNLELQLALDRATKRSFAAEAAVEALRQREATLRTELRAVRAVQNRPLAHGTLPSSHLGGRSTDYRDGAKDVMQVLFKYAPNA